LSLEGLEGDLAVEVVSFTPWNEAVERLPGVFRPEVDEDVAVVLRHLDDLARHGNRLADVVLCLLGPDGFASEGDGLDNNQSHERKEFSHGEIQNRMASDPKRKSESASSERNAYTSRWEWRSSCIRENTQQVGMSEESLLETSREA